MGDADRFWAKVNKAGGNGPDGDCWVWTAFREPDGYGRFNHSRGQLAHRFSFELHNGPIPSGMQILHRCDNPACVRPDHLFLGTHQENMSDRNAKRRHAHGGRSGSAILSESQVVEIRRLKNRGVPAMVLAARFGVAKRTINGAASGNTWAHLRVEK